VIATKKEKEIDDLKSQIAELQARLVAQPVVDRSVVDRSVVDRSAEIARLEKEKDDLTKKNGDLEKEKEQLKSLLQNSDYLFCAANKSNPFFSSDSVTKRARQYLLYRGEHLSKSKWTHSGLEFSVMDYIIKGYVECFGEKHILQSPLHITKVSGTLCYFHFSYKNILMEVDTSNDENGEIKRLFYVFKVSGNKEGDRVLYKNLNQVNPDGSQTCFGFSGDAEIIIGQIYECPSKLGWKTPSGFLFPLRIFFTT
jgi:hypothetical protein